MTDTERIKTLQRLVYRSYEWIKEAHEEQCGHGYKECPKTCRTAKLLQKLNCNRGASESKE